MIDINTSWFRPIIKHAEVSMEPRDDASGGGRGNTMRIAGPQCTRHTGMVSGEDMGCREGRESGRSPGGGWERSPGRGLRYSQYNTVGIALGVGPLSIDTL